MRIPKLSFALLLLLVISLPAMHLLIEQQANKTLSQAISDATQAANATATKLLINEVYPRLADKLGFEDVSPNAAPHPGLSGDALKETDRTIRNFMLGTDIMKVKLYNLQGTTVYSSELAQIGQDQSKNPEFFSATQGIVGSQITHRGKFSGMEGEVFEKDLVSSYIPVRDKTGMVIGVAEIYTDRTPVIDSALGGEGKLHPYLLMMQAVQLLLLVFLGWNIWSAHLASDSAGS